MWYRQVPWAGKSPHQVIAKVMKGKRPPIDGTFRLTKGTDRAWMRVPKLPHTLKKLIELCWHTHPASRPAAAKLFSRFADDVSPAVRKLALTPPRRGSASYSAAPASGAEGGADNSITSRADSSIHSQASSGGVEEEEEVKDAVGDGSGGARGGGALGADLVAALARVLLKGEEGTRAWIQPTCRGRRRRQRRAHEDQAGRRCQQHCDGHSIASRFFARVDWEENIGKITHVGEHFRLARAGMSRGGRRS